MYTWQRLIATASYVGPAASSEQRAVLDLCAYNGLLNKCMYNIERSCIPYLCQNIDSIIEGSLWIYLCILVYSCCGNLYEHSLFILHYRPCSDDDFIQLDPHPVCSSDCEYSVKCLDTSVPWDHLAVSYTHVCVLAASFEIVHALTMHAEQTPPTACLRCTRNLALLQGAVQGVS